MHVCAYVKTLNSREIIDEQFCLIYRTFFGEKKTVVKLGQSVSRSCEIDLIPARTMSHLLDRSGDLAPHLVSRGERNLHLPAQVLVCVSKLCSDLTVFQCD